MGRRNDHSRKEIKDMAIKAGRELIAADGLQNFSIRKVATKIGYSAGTLYNIFDDYYDLLFHINSMTLDDLEIYINGNLDQRLGGIETLKNLAVCYIEFAYDRNTLWSALFEYQLAQDSEPPEWYMLRVSSIFAIAEEVLLPYVRGDIETAQRAAKILWGGVHGICSLGLTKKMGNDSAASIKAMAQSLVENYIEGLSQTK